MVLDNLSVDQDGMLWAGGTPSNKFFLPKIN
jgi:hypothetical protein